MTTRRSLLRAATSALGVVVAGCRRRVGRLGQGAGSASAGASARPMAGAPEGTLLAHTVRIGRGVPITKGEYFWRSESEIVTLRPSRDPKRYELALLDTRTGRETPLSEFNQRYRRELSGQVAHMRVVGVPGETVHYLPPRFHLAPDGQHVLWRSTWRKWAVATLAGGEFASWPAVGAAEALWLDDQHWAEFVPVLKGESYFIRKILVRGCQASDPALEVTTPEFPDALLAGVAPGRRILFYGLTLQVPTTVVKMTEVRVEGVRAKVRPFQVHLPFRAEVSEARLSPMGDRIAWLLATARTTGMPDAFRMYVSAPDGSAMRELGWLRPRSKPSPQSLTNERFDWPEGLRWMPDGSHLSFTLGDALYLRQASPP